MDFEGFWYDDGGDYWWPEEQFLGVPAIPPPADAWDWSEELVDEWSEWPAVGPDAVAAAQPPEDAWAFDDEAPVVHVPDSYQQADFFPPPPADAWSFDDDAAVSAVPDSYQQSDATQASQPAEDGWAFEDEGAPDEIAGDGPVGPDVTDAPVLDVWDWAEEAADEWAEAQPVGPDAVAVDGPPADAWVFDDDAPVSAVPDSYQQSDAAVAVEPTPADAWVFDDDAATVGVPDSYQQSDTVFVADRPHGEPWQFDGVDEDLDELSVDDFGNFEIDAQPADVWVFDDEAPVVHVPDSYQQSDTVAPVGSPELSPADAWSFDDDAVVSLFPDSYQQSNAAVVIGSADLSVETGPVFDGVDEDLDELTVDDFGNFDPEAILDDAWDWTDDTEAWQPDEQVLGADVVVVVERPHVESWVFDDDFTDEVPLEDGPVGADYFPSVERIHDDPWSFDDEGVREDFAHEGPVGLDGPKVAPPDDRVGGTYGLLPDFANKPRRKRKLEDVAEHVAEVVADAELPIPILPKTPIQAIRGKNIVVTELSAGALEAQRKRDDDDEDDIAALLLLM